MTVQPCKVVHVSQCILQAVIIMEQYIVTYVPADGSHDAPGPTLPEVIMLRDQ